MPDPNHDLYFEACAATGFEPIFGNRCNSGLFDNQEWFARKSLKKTVNLTNEIFLFLGTDTVTRLKAQCGIEPCGTMSFHKGDIQLQHVHRFPMASRIGVGRS